MQRNILLAAVVVGLALLAAIRWLPRPTAEPAAVSPGRVAAAMRTMMGAARADALPVRGPADGKPRLTPALKDGVKEFLLSAEPVRWEYQDGKTVLAWGYDGHVPGPEIRVTEGERVRVVFTNRLPQPTTVHWHGLDVPASMDGVPGISQPPVAPGASFTYEFTATPAGTHFYHTHGSKHGDEAQQMDMGLSGAFIVESPSQPAVDREYTLVLDEWQTSPMGGGMMNMAMMMDGGHVMDYDLFTVNGRAFPATAPLLVQEGERVRLRVVNAGTSTIHPMHLHGHQFRITAADGNPVPPGAQWTRNTLTVHPGETYDVEFIADNPGVWLFHCHELHHADGGMIVPLQYEGYALPTVTDDPAPAAAPAGGHMMQMSN